MYALDESVIQLTMLLLDIFDNILEGSAEVCKIFPITILLL